MLCDSAVRCAERPVKRWARVRCAGGAPRGMHPRGAALQARHQAAAALAVNAAAWRSRRHRRR